MIPWIRLHKYFCSLLIVAGLGAAGPALAQPGVGEPVTDAEVTDAEELSLGSVLQATVRQSPSLELARIDIALADAAVLEARGVDDWIVDASLLFSTQRLVDLGLSDLRTRGSADVELSRPLSTGGVVSVGASTGFSEGVFGQPDLWSDTIELSVYQPLLRGRGERYARANIALARISRDASALQIYAEATGVVRNVISAYWDVALSLRNLAIARSSLELALERLRITRAGIEGGAVAPTEALAVEQIIATREEEILSAELAVANRSLDLRRLVGLEIGPGQINIVTVAPPEVEAQQFDLNELLARAYQSSPELAVLAKQEEGAELEVEITDNGLLPRLDLSIAAGPSGAGDDPAAAAEDLVSFDGISIGASLTFQHTIGNRAGRGRTEAARGRLMRTRVTAQDLRAQIALAMVRAVKVAESAQARMAISRRAITLAEQNIDAEKARFELGRATNFDVLQRQEELKQAQLRYAGAVVDYLDALSIIDSLTGDLLPRYGIELDVE